MITAEQVMTMRRAVADTALQTIDKYRAGQYHGREVAGILANLFESANDTFEHAYVDECAKKGVRHGLGD